MTDRERLARALAAADDACPNTGAVYWPEIADALIAAALRKVTP